MPKKPSEFKVAVQRKERLIQEAWQEDLEEYLGFLQFFRWAEVYHPEIVAEFRADKGVRHYFGNMDDVNHDLIQAKELSKRQAKAKSDKLSNSRRSKVLTKEALAKEIAILKNDGEKTTIIDLSEIFRVDVKTMRGFIKRNFNMDWKTYVQNVLDQE